MPAVFKLVYDESIIHITDNSIVSDCDNATLTIVPEGDLNDSENYVGFTGLNYIQTYEYDQIKNTNLQGDLFAAKKKWSLWKEKYFYRGIDTLSISLFVGDSYSNGIWLTTPINQYYAGKKDFLVNLGVDEQPVESITVKLPKKGIYELDSLDVYSVAMNDYPNSIKKLSNDALEDVQFDINTVTGSINIDNDKILCISIPYLEGWEAYIDDKEVEIFRINEKYLGIKVSKGQHSIRLVYQTPYYKLGFILSCIGAVFFMFILCSKKLFKKNYINEQKLIK